MMRLPRFTYLTPRTISDAVKMMGDAGPAGQFVAGGTDLYPNMKRRQQNPKTGISVMRLKPLNQNTGNGGDGPLIRASVTFNHLCEQPAVQGDYSFPAGRAKIIVTTRL